jgi:uncharacterized phage protein (TIGR01671 family)
LEAHARTAGGVVKKLKFRCWDEDRKIFLYAGDTLEDGFSFLLNLNGDLIAVKEKARGNFDAVYARIGYNLELMQFTGYKDKNGKEIYEGDIVTYRVENQISGGYLGTNAGFIFYDERTLSFAIKDKRRDNGKDLYISINQGYDAYGGSLEIIGNIFENPELLQKNNL